MKRTKRLLLSMAALSTGIASACSKDADNPGWDGLIASDAGTDGERAVDAGLIFHPDDAGIDAAPDVRHPVGTLPMDSGRDAEDAAADAPADGSDAGDASDGGGDQ